MRRIVPGVPEIDYDAIVEFACRGGVGRFRGTELGEEERSRHGRFNSCSRDWSSGFVFW